MREHSKNHLMTATYIGSDRVTGCSYTTLLDSTFENAHPWGKGGFDNLCAANLGTRLVLLVGVFEPGRRSNAPVLDGSGDPADPATL